MGALIDLTGKRFGRLLVISYAGNNARGKALWNCICDCGQKYVALGESLRRGDTQSCGCYHRERSAKCHTIHGGCGTRIFTIWRSMKARCERPSCIEYKRYGARGIKVCSEWQDFTVFRAWAYANGYKDNLSIDRIDSNGNYEPQNCRWSTVLEQARNKRNNIMWRGKALTAWCDELGRDVSTVRQRITKLGWDFEKAIMTPTKGETQ